MVFCRSVMVLVAEIGGWGAVLEGEGGKLGRFWMTVEVHCEFVMFRWRIC